jgi:SSS family solute:Na+ symporter
MNAYFTLGDWIVIVAYLGAMIALGIWFGRDQHTTRDYFLGGRDIPWWGIGASIVATETSALTIIGVPAIAYGGNLMFIQMIVGYVIARVILAVVLVPHYMKGEIYSPYQLLEQHLGRGARRLAGGFFLFLEPLSAGVRVFVACIPIRLMLGEQVCSLGGLVDPILGAILLFVFLSLIYTYIGGMKAVVWTDAIQMVLFVAGGLYALFYIPTLIDGGWSAALTEAGQAGKLAWLNPDFTLSAPFNIWMGIIGGTVLVLSSHGADQLIVQRVLACRDIASGRKALVFSAVIIFPLFLTFLFVGVMLWVFYQHHPFQIPLPESRPGIKSNDFIFPIFIVTEMPSPMRGFLIVAILSAAMSSISSAISALASVSTMDFLKPLWPGRDEAWFVRFSKHSTVAWAGRPHFRRLAHSRSHLRPQRRLLPPRSHQRRAPRRPDPRPLRPPRRPPRRPRRHGLVLRLHEPDLLARHDARPAPLVAGHLRRRGLLALVHPHRHPRHPRRRLARPHPRPPDRGTVSPTVPLPRATPTSLRHDPLDPPAPARRLRQRRA